MNTSILRLVMLFIVCGVLCALCGCVWSETEENPDYLMMDDSRYPYAGLPRIVIETKNFHEIRDRETEIPSHFQMYGENAPLTEVLDLTVRGRGNSSFKMPKYGMKLEFTDKVSLLGMPKSRDWALVGNFGDKTYLRNYMMYRLSEWLHASYTPKCRFVELYLNQEYKGLYLLYETVKVSKNRVNIPENDTTFLFEKEGIKKYDPPYIITDDDNIFHIKSPKNPNEETQKLLLDHLNEFETQLSERNFKGENSIDKWVDIDDFVLYYWVQEFSKNEDGNFARSIYMTWEKGGPIHFGPLWDFDLAFGNASYEVNQSFDGWYIRRGRWFSPLIINADIREAVDVYWAENKTTFKALIDSIPLYRSIIEKAVKNEFRRWPILQNTENWALKDPYKTYDEAVEAMIKWMKSRYSWIEKQIF